jgi:hypothetical protein
LMVLLMVLSQLPVQLHFVLVLVLLLMLQM